MAYVDKAEEFSDSQVVTATALSTNVIDLTQGVTTPVTLTDINIGQGEGMYLVVQVDATFTAGGSATMTVTLESDSDSSLSTSVTTHFTSTAIAVATLVAGYEVARIKLPPGTYERYLGVRYTIATGPMTAGSISAFLTKDFQGQRAYGSGFTLS